MRVVSIDPAIRNTGFAVIDGDFRAPRALEYGTLSLPAKLSQGQCLLAIHEHVCALIEKWQPDELAIEGIIYVQSHRTAITMGSARGAVVLAAAKHGLQIMRETGHGGPWRCRQATGRLHDARPALALRNTRARCSRCPRHRLHPHGRRRPHPRPPLPGAEVYLTEKVAITEDEALHRIE